MRRTSIVVWLVVAGVAALGLFHVKHEVQTVEEELLRVERAILAHQEAIHVLEAEFAYRTQTTRIARQARDHLKLAPLEPHSFVGFDDLPWRGDEAPADPADPAVPSETPTSESPKAFLASAEAGQ